MSFRIPPLKRIQSFSSQTANAFQIAKSLMYLNCTEKCFLIIEMGLKIERGIFRDIRLSRMKVNNNFN
jgi:hypothetical protein